jgi:hypothetical protein
MRKLALMVLTVLEITSVGVLIGLTLAALHGWTP